MEKEENSLKNFKRKYATLKKKFSLPPFRNMNEDFQIEKMSEEETEMPLREIKRIMGEKFSNYHRFVEVLINPSNAPLFVFSMLKSLDDGEKAVLMETYGKLTEIEILMVETDIEYSDRKEAEFIKNSYVTWQDIKKNLSTIIDKIKSKGNNERKNGNAGYFG